MRRWITARKLLRIAFACLLLLTSPPQAHAHSLSPGVLSLTETSPGIFLTRWTQSFDAYGRKEAMRPRFEQGCLWEEQLLRCTESNLGTIYFDRQPSERSMVLVSVQWLSGESEQLVVASDEVSVAVTGRSRSSLRVFGDYVELGVKHILSGIDHLAFVLGLVILTGFTRGLLAVVTGFTIAHATTLALSTLQIVALPSAPVLMIIQNLH